MKLVGDLADEGVRVEDPAEGADLANGRDVDRDTPVGELNSRVVVVLAQWSELMVIG